MSAEEPERDVDATEVPMPEDLELDDAEAQDVRGGITKPIDKSSPTLGGD